jgi:hypothetical protein
MSMRCNEYVMKKGGPRVPPGAALGFLYYGTPPQSVVTLNM